MKYCQFGVSPVNHSDSNRLLVCGNFNIHICAHLLKEGEHRNVLLRNVLLLLKDLSFIYICYYCSWCCVSCGGPKKSPRTSSIVQIIFSFPFWPFEISEGILRNQKIIIGLDSFSNQRLI